MQPEPDDKDWTWVLDRPCPDCGYDAATVDARDVADRLRTGAAELAAALDRPDARVRPQPTTWSPLEYGAHVRDVFRVFGVRVSLVRNSDDPLFPNWDQDETALAERYWEQDPAVVRGELVTEGERLAADLDTVRGAEWSRPGRRDNGSVFTLGTLARYLLHDVEHHAWDVRNAHSS